MNIAFLGTRGIPAKYGGLETFVEEISKRLSKKGYTIYVLCRSDRFFEDTYENVHRMHVPKFSKTHLTIPVIGDVLSTFYLLIKHFNEIDIYFYTNIGGAVPAVLLRILGKKVIINSDGVEWKRMRRRICYVPWYLKPIYNVAGNFLYFLEALSCIISTVTIADSIAIKKYLEEKHHAKHVFHVAYGARELWSKKSDTEEKDILKKYNITTNDYYLTVSRIVAENHIDMEIEGFKKTKSKKKLVLVGNFESKDQYTQYLKKIKGNDDNILLLDPIYDQEVLGILRKHCYAYIHSYEVGGTNPSLLEQMMFEKPILSYDVPFNKEVLKEGGIYFTDSSSLSKKINQLESTKIEKNEKANVFKKRINERYNWEKITDEYLELFNSIIN
jgi:glycosyltransferase involved in cell wall biosynthesis